MPNRSATHNRFSHQPALQQARTSLANRLSDRREEIENALLTRTFSIDDPRENVDPNYVNGLRVAVSIAIDYGLEVIVRGEERAPPPPPQLLAQARLAVRAGVDLGTVLRRYSAGYGLLVDFLIEEASRSNLHGAILQRVLRAQAAFDRLLKAISEEYAREASDRSHTSEQRRAKRIERLLNGEALVTTEFTYNFEGSHLGAIASGPEISEAVQALATSLSVNLLTVRFEQDTIWAWFGGRNIPKPKELRDLISKWSDQASLAIGEPGSGMAGWRLTHWQARAAWSVSMRGTDKLVRYADVAILAALLKDNLLATSLREIYLEPLTSKEADGGRLLIETLLAYISSERNISSTAVMLGVTRRTVANRLRKAETKLGRPLGRELTELDVALRLNEFEFEEEA